MGASQQTRDLMSEQFYYQDEKGTRIGPLSWEVMLQLYEAGTVTDDSMVEQGEGNEQLMFSDAKVRQERLALLPPVPQAQPDHIDTVEASTGSESPPLARSDLPQGSQASWQPSTEVGKSQRSLFIIPLPGIVIVAVAILLGVIWTILGSEWGTLGSVVAVATVAAVVAWAVLHYQCWHALPIQFRTTSPGKAVGFLFIPFYNLYWAFVTWPQLSRGYRQWQSERQLELPNIIPGLEFVLAMVFVAYTVFGVIGGLFDLVVIMILIDLGSVVVFALYYFNLAKFANGLIRDEIARND